MRNCVGQGGTGEEAGASRQPLATNRRQKPATLGSGHHRRRSSGRLPEGLRNGRPGAAEQQQQRRRAR